MLVMCQWQLTFLSSQWHCVDDDDDINDWQMEMMSMMMMLMLLVTRSVAVDVVGLFLLIRFLSNRSFLLFSSYKMMMTMRSH